MTILQVNSKARRTARDLPPMSIFRTEGYDGPGYYIRVTPHSTMFASSMIKERESRGDVLTLNTYTGIIGYIQGHCVVVEPLSANLSISS